METNKKKSTRKLLFQISAAIVPVFLLMTAAVAWSVYSSTVSGFLDAQNLIWHI